MPNNQYVTKEVVIAYKQLFGLRSAIYGGLIIGNSHEEGGIISLSGTDQYFSVNELEGGEYIMCATATERYIDRLTEINQYKGPYKKPCEHSLSSLFSCIRMSSASECLLLSGYNHFVVNKSATSFYLSELDSINKECALEEIQSRKYSDSLLLKELLL